MKLEGINCVTAHNSKGEERCWCTKLRLNKLLRASEAAVVPMETIYGSVKSDCPALDWRAVPQQFRDTRFDTYPIRQDITLWEDTV